MRSHTERAGWRAHMIDGSADSRAPPAVWALAGRSRPASKPPPVAADHHCMVASSSVVLVVGAFELMAVDLHGKGVETQRMPPTSIGSHRKSEAEDAK